MNVLVCLWYSGNYQVSSPYTESPNPAISCSQCDDDQVDCIDGLCSGCFSSKYHFCQDFSSKCKLIEGECPLDCLEFGEKSDDRNAHLCGDCRDTCGSCMRSEALLECQPNFNNGGGDAL